MMQTNDVALTVPDRAPTWNQLHDQSPYASGVHEDPTGGIVVHRCHPESEATDFFAYANRHETMKGYVDKQIYLFSHPDESPLTPGVSRWNRAVSSFHVRMGSHEDCAVCQHEADPDDLLAEVVETITEQVGGNHIVAKSGVYGEQPDGSHRAEVYLDTNTTRHWEDHIVAHPYVQMAGAREVGEGGNAHSPDETLRITLRTHYPNVVPEIEL